MKTKILIASVALVMMIACSKDTFQTKPQLTFKSVNTTVLAKNESIRFVLKVTDAEGDIQDSLWVQQVVRNCPASGFTSPYAFPEFTATKNLQGEIEVCYSYGNNLGCPIIVGPRCPNQNDSSIFRFWIRDAAKNVSDTISSDEVVILQ